MSGEVKPRDALRRIRVTGIAHAPESLRCLFGWHRVRFFREADGHWRPRCSRCRRIAYWYQTEGRP